MTQQLPPAILQIVREPLKPGSETAYEIVEDDTARQCVELKCPHPYLAMEPISGPKEVWWLNEFQSEADQGRVETAYSVNRALMAVLLRNGRQKAALTDTPTNTYARYRSHLSRRRAWTLAGARFVVIVITKQADIVDGSVFEADDGDHYILIPVPTRQQAETEASKLDRNARVFAVLPAGVCRHRNGSLRIPTLGDRIRSVADRVSIEARRRGPVCPEQNRSRREAGLARTVGGGG
jgi:hypothetical protein